MGSGEEMRARWGAGGGGGESAGGCGHALAAFKHSLNTQCGHALAAFQYSLNIQKMQPGVGSGEARVVWCGQWGW